MSFLDKVAATLMPAATDEQRREARSAFETLAAGVPWAREILAHHQEIEAAFAETRNATGEGRLTACRRLGELLTGHSTAEEAVIYPAMANRSAKHHATMAYEEQAAAKVQMAQLEVLDPGSSEWMETFEHVKAAVEQHVYQEEGDWFPELARDVPDSESGRLAQRYREEYDRYARGGSSASAAMSRTGDAPYGRSVL